MRAPHAASSAPPCHFPSAAATRHGTAAVLRTHRCRALLFVNAVAPFLLAEEEMIRSRAPLCSLTPSLISSTLSLSHFLP